MLIFRLADRCGHVRNQTLDKATGEHFSLPDQSLQDLSITVIEQSKRNNNFYRKEREEYHKNLFNTFGQGPKQKERKEYHRNCFNTFYKGLNQKKKQWGGLALFCVNNGKLFFFCIRGEKNYLPPDKQTVGGMILECWLRITSTK